MSIKPVPEGYHSLTPYLVVNDAAKAIAFYQNVFGAIELFRLPMGDRIGHAELRIGDSHLMLADECLEMGAHAPKGDTSPPISLMVYVADVDATFARAIQTGAAVVRPLQDQFYGDRSGTVKDPFGHVWNIATHIEDVAPEELQRRMQSMQKES